MEKGSQIELRGTLTLGDLARFQYFHVWRRFWLSVITFAFLLVLVFTINSSGDPRFSGVIIAGLFILLLSLLALLVGVRPYWRAKRQLAVQVFLREPLIYVFTSEAISTAGTGISSSIAWRLMRWVRVRETNSLFLLYYAKNQAIIIPKRFFQSSEEIERWRQLVALCVGPQFIEKPSFVGRWC